MMSSSNVNNTDNMNTELNQARNVAGGVRTRPISDEARPKPTIGCSHFRSDVKKIRRGSYTILDASTDILDNIKYDFTGDLKITRNDNGRAIKFQFCDNDNEGFGEKIYSNGTENPLCMGHETPNHVDDNLSSEFGVGLKESSIYLSEKMTVVTRIVRNTGETVYVKVTLDFQEMMKREDPQLSREWTDFREIAQDEYESLHTKVCNFDCGSSIILEYIRDENHIFPTDDIFEEHIRKTYHEKIKAGKVFKINGKLIEQNADVFDDETCAARVVKRDIRCKFTNTNVIENVFCKETTSNGEVNRLNLTEKNLIKACGKSKSDKEEFDEYFDDIPEKHRLCMKSTTSVNSDLSEIMGKNSIEFIRDNRSHGNGINDPTPDGYGNNIANKLWWSSKELSSFLGISSTKGQIIHKENRLTKFLTLLLKRNRQNKSKSYSLIKERFQPEGEADTEGEVEETNSSQDDESDEQVLSLQKISADPLPIATGDWRGSVTQDNNEGGVEESKGGDDDENCEQARAVQHNTVIPLHVSVGNGQRSPTQEPDEESSDEESSDEESSDEESSDEENSVTEDASDNNNVTDRNITATICDKAEQIYTDSTNIDNLTQEDDEEINKLMDKIIAIHTKYKD